MKKCPECHSVCPENSNFCHYCGFNLREVEVKRVCFVIADNHGAYYTEASRRFDTLDLLRNRVDLLKFSRWAIFQCFDEDLDNRRLFTPIAKYLVDEVAKAHLITDDKSPVTFRPSK